MLSRWQPLIEDTPASTQFRPVLGCVDTIYTQIKFICYKTQESADVAILNPTPTPTPTRTKSFCEELAPRTALERWSTSTRLLDVDSLQHAAALALFFWWAKKCKVALALVIKGSCCGQNYSQLVHSEAIIGCNCRIFWFHRAISRVLTVSHTATGVMTQSVSHRMGDGAPSLSRGDDLQAAALINQTWILCCKQ